MRDPDPSRRAGGERAASARRAGGEIRREDASPAPLPPARRPLRPRARGGVPRYGRPPTPRRRHWRSSVKWWCPSTSTMTRRSGYTASQIPMRLPRSVRISTSSSGSGRPAPVSARRISVSRGDMLPSRTRASASSRSSRFLRHGTFAIAHSSSRVARRRCGKGAPRSPLGIRTIASPITTRSRRLEEAAASAHVLEASPTASPPIVPSRTMRGATLTPRTPRPRGACCGDSTATSRGASSAPLRNGNPCSASAVCPTKNAPAGAICAYAWARRTITACIRRSIESGPSSPWRLSPSCCGARSRTPANGASRSPARRRLAVTPWARAARVEKLSPSSAGSARGG